MGTKAKSTNDAGPTGEPEASSVAPKPAKKFARLLALLQRPEGASVEDLSNELGWLQHTTRAALTGLRKKGHEVDKTKEGSVTIYRVAP